MKTVIMAGGKGTRLWPLSIEDEPKQFVKFINGKSLFQHTLERFANQSSEIFVVTIDKYVEKVLMQTSEIGISLDGIIIEPVRRGTLSAMTLSVKEIGGNEPILFTPSDHIMDNFSADKYEDYARFFILVFGIKPKVPSTEYGYVLPEDIAEVPIEIFNLHDNEKLPKPRRVSKFKEKPDFETAQKYIKEGYLWNSGIYMFSPDIFIEELRKYSPQHYAFLEGNIDYEDIPESTIDYIISEKSNRMAVVPLDVFWTDLGSFKAIYDYFEKDKNNNVIIGDAMLDNSKNTLAINCDEKTVVASELNNSVIVNCHNRIFIGKLSDTKTPKKFSHL